MNLYFLVEGKQTERKVYPQWLKILLPQLSQIKNLNNVFENSYYLFSGEGFPALLNNHLKNAIEEVNDKKVFNYFVLCLDADEATVDSRRQEVLDFMSKEKLGLNNECKFVIIIQNRCFETWFLGNRKVFKRNPSNQPLISYVNFYNVLDSDPELMPGHDSFNSISQFHHSYLKETLRERNIRYSKSNPGVVCEEHFLNELISRVDETQHLVTFRNFIEFCQTIK